MTLDVPLLAQRLLVGREALADAQVHVTHYQAFADFQALEEANRHYVPGQSSAPQPEGSWLGFVYSKPQVEQGTVHVHALEALDEHGQPTDELWLKLKRPEAVATALGIRSAPEADSGAELVRALIAQLNADTDVALAPDRELEQGPVWLSTPLALPTAPDGALSCPSLRTPLDVAPRFAGMFYVKLPSARWLASP